MAKRQARAIDEVLGAREARRRVIAIAIFGAAYLALVGLVLLPQGYLRDANTPLAVLQQR